MNNINSLQAGDESLAWVNVRALLITGLGSAALAVVLRFSLGLNESESLLRSILLVARIAFLGVGLLAAGRAVILFPRSVLTLGSAALTAALAYWAIEAEWDSLRLLVRVLTVVAAAATFLLLMPRPVRQGVVSLLIIVHFGGILTAVTSVPLPGAPASWLSVQLWSRFYRPYLQFVYLTNAYHFYSPEPGPACLLWFRIEYSDGSSRWAKIPDPKEHCKDPLLVEYYRRLPIAHNINQIAPVPFVPPEFASRRARAGELLGIPTPAEIAMQLPAVPQFQPPVGVARRFLESYAGFVAKARAHSNATISVTGIKIYRVVHAIVHPGRFAQGMDPCDPTLYLPYFQGEFDREGNMKDSQDPFLYWLVPILDASKASTGTSQGGDSTSASKQHARIEDYLRLHAGSSPWEEKE